MFHVQDDGGRPLRPQPGSQIDPRDAVGRVQITASARDHLLAGNNLALTDPRRMGKTVWLDVFCANPGSGLVAVKIDYEGVQSTEGFLLRTASGLSGSQSVPGQVLGRVRSFLGKMFDNVDISAGPINIKAGIAGGRSPTALLADTIRGVESHLDADSLFVMTMDEVPIAISNIASNEGPAAAGQLLQTLRELRRRDSQLRWIVCGSIGFHHVLRRCETTEGAINDLVNLPLGPFELDEAKELARRLLLGIDRAGGESAIDALLEHSGRIPFLIHSLAHRLQTAGMGHVSASDVADAFEAFVEDRDGSRAVTHLLSRLDQFYGSRTADAEAVLDLLAMSGPARTADLGVPNDLVDDLIDDHYLLESRGQIAWRYDVLRRVWIHRRRLT